MAIPDQHDGRPAIPGAAEADPTKPVLPGPLTVLTQVIADLFGKDVQETATFSYEWVADQMGHFALGFELTYLLSWIIYPTPPPDPFAYFRLAAWVVGAFVIKEASDFVRELLKARRAKSTFRFNGVEIGYNVFTALFYIILGALVAGFALWSPRYGLIALVISVPFALFLGYLWLRLKITFQQGGFPYLYRLATFPSPIDRDTAAFIVDLSKPRAPWAEPSDAYHLILAGPLESGKSSLATGIGTEFAFRLGIGRYTTLAKLVQSALRAGGKPPGPEFNDGRILWPWQTSDLLVIDDVDVLSDHFPTKALGIEVEHSIAQARVDALKELIPGPLRLALKHRRTVWVVGDIDDGELTRWRGMIADVIGVDPGRVRTFKFDRKIQDLRPERARPLESERVAQ